MKTNNLANWLLEDNITKASEYIKEAEEVVDEVEVDVAKLTKLVEKLCKHAEKTEDEGLEKLCGEFKKALGIEEESEETEDKK
jgi:DNA-binding ferritin-like protein